jgi:hypothetical protein
LKTEFFAILVFIYVFTYQICIIYIGGIFILNILIVGATGYLGKNFCALCKEFNISFSSLDLRQVKNAKIDKFEVVVDFSMINRNTLPWLKENIDTFKINHNLLLDKILKSKKRYIRISSIFDVRSFIRNDSYTMLSHQISTNVIYRIPNCKVIYTHAVYGGTGSKSFIDLDIVKNLTFQESIRDYIYFRDFGEKLLSLISINEQHDVEVEFGTGKPYLTSDIKKAVFTGNFKNLIPIKANSQIFNDFSKKNLVCSVAQTNLPKISTVLLNDHLVHYLSNA